MMAPEGTELVAIIIREVFRSDGELLGQVLTRNTGYAIVREIFV